MKTFIIAELSGNHRGNKERALKLIKAASDAGADAVKFQTYKPEDFVLPNTHTLPSGLWKGQDMYELYKRAMTPWEWHSELFQYARSLGLEPFSSPFSLEAVDFLETLGCARYKIASFEIGYYSLIKKCLDTMKPVIISTGCADEGDVQRALSAGNVHMVETVKTICHHNQDITLLRCTSKYPTPESEANLSGIPMLKDKFKTKVGLSDHTKSTVIPALAVAAGATVIEKHLDLDDKLGVDGAFSLSPGEFQEMVKNIRLAEAALGKPVFHTPEDGMKYRRRYDEKTGKWLRYIPEEKTKELNIEHTNVESSNIASAGYDIGQNILEVKFHNGAIYRYMDVPQELFTNLISAESVGKYFNKYIKNIYRFERK